MLLSKSYLCGNMFHLDSLNTDVSFEKRPMLQMLMLFFIVGALSVTALALKESADVRSRAASQTGSITIDGVEIVPTPKEVLTEPYARVVVGKPTYRVGEFIPVGLFLNTDSQDAVEFTAVLSYDPNAVSISPDEVTSTGVFKVLDVQKTGEGEITVNLFITPEAGQEAIFLPEEQKVATLLFLAVRPVPDTSVHLVFGEGTEKTGLYQLNLDPEQPPSSILQSIEGTSFAIVPAP